VEEAWKKVLEDVEEVWKKAVGEAWKKAVEDVEEAWKKAVEEEWKKAVEYVEEARSQNRYHFKWFLERQKNLSVKVESAWEAQMNSQLWENFNFCSRRAKLKFRELNSPRAV
jgi:hypothetical protein